MSTYGDTNHRLRGWCNTATSETGHLWHHFAGFIGPVFTVRARELRWLFPCLGAPYTHPSPTLANARVRVCDALILHLTLERPL